MKDLQARLAVLELRHQQLNEQVKKGYSSYLDDPHLGKLKREKLLVKREIDDIKKALGE